LFRLLFIGDPSEDTDRLLNGLRRQGQAVVAAQEVEEARGNHDLVLLEPERPAGQEALGYLGAEPNHPPVLALIGPNSLGWGRPLQGIDDFMVLPGSGPELLARIELVMARFGRGGSEDRLVFGDLVIDLAGYEVSLTGEPVDLTYKEYELLRFLALRPGRVFTREALLSQVWGYDYYGGSRTVDVHIRRLRAKIEDPNHSFVDTVRGVGYAFRPGPGLS